MFLDSFLLLLYTLHLTIEHMKDHIFVYQNSSYTIRPFKTVDNVIIFKVLQPAEVPNMLELAVMYAWVDKRLVEMTARNNINSNLLDACSVKIKAHYQLN